MDNKESTGMTENLLIKLEDRIMTLVTEMESMQKLVAHLKAENAALKSDKDTFTLKLQGLIALLDTLESAESVQPMKPAIQLPSDYSVATA